MDREPRKPRRPKKDEPKKAEKDTEEKESNTLVLTSHREFAVAQNEIFKRLNENPEAVSLLLVNPALAIEELDVELSPELRHHVLHTLQHPPALRERRAELEASLKEALGEAPQPNDPAWLSRVLFETLQASPVKTEGRAPVYKRVVSNNLINHASQIRDRWEEGKANPRRPRPKGMRVRLKTPGDKIRRMDLEAPVPDDLEPVKDTPETVSLEDLYFYRDQNPLVGDLLELGVIQRRAFPIQSADGFRKVKSGEQRSVFTTWIKSASFPVKDKGRRDEPDR